MTIQAQTTGILAGGKMIKLKDLLSERYVSKSSDTIEDVYQSLVDSLEDLSELFKNMPEERLLSRTLEKQSMMVRRMITKSKSYQDIKIKT